MRHLSPRFTASHLPANPRDLADDLGPGLFSGIGEQLPAKGLHLAEIEADPHKLTAKAPDVGAGMAWSTPEEARARAEREKPMWREAVRLSGAQLTPLPSDDGLIAPQQLDRHIARRGPVHHSQPRIVTITQSTENGRVWSPDALAEFIGYAHQHDLLVHVDGSRIANAIAALDVLPREAIGDADIVTVGGTKNGMLFGDAVLIRRPEHFPGIRFVQKQIGHLASKHRFISAQFEAMLHDDLWLQTAAHANRLAATLSAGFMEAGLELAAPTEANEVFVVLDAATTARVREHFAVHAPDTTRPVIRFVCSWATTEDDVAAVLKAIAPD